MEWAAFCTLSQSRGGGEMGPSPIPLTEIEAYMRLYGIRGADLVDEWLYLIRQMDAEYLKCMSEKAKANDATRPRN